MTSPLLVLPDQSWVCMRSMLQRQSNDTSCGEESIAFILAPSKNGQLMLKRPPDGSQDNWDEGCRVHGFLLIVWWSGNRVVSRILIISLLVPTSLELHTHPKFAVTILHMGAVLVPAEKLKDMHQIAIYVTWEGTRALSISALLFLGASLVAQIANNLPAMQETLI